MGLLSISTSWLQVWVLQAESCRLQSLAAPCATRKVLPSSRRLWLQDAVVHRGKLIRMYKRPGHRVIINMDGDLIVRPTFAEASTQVRYS